MVKKKVKLAFIENNTERRVSYRKRQKEFLTKARELNTPCDVELATFIDSPYHKKAEVFSKFKDLTTQEKQLTKRINEIENEIEKVRKENKKMEYTNQMYGLLNGEQIPNRMNPEDLSGLTYVINKSLKQINDAIKAKSHEDGSTSTAPQTIGGLMDSSVTSSDMSWDPLLAPVDAPVLSEIPLLVPSIVTSETNFEKPSAPLNSVHVTPKFSTSS
ncbi:MADS-box transcription factor PHERES 1-like [Solanum lycopersicum]|uniref:MADS-box transcription factor PHERES 1-like n=1 Tax=Solanum lycopersicum TaxID=4081 RepID=UPI0002BCAEA6|nr:agamous-like MADS-box protein AGL80 [Solanum lycopersicum]